MYRRNLSEKLKKVVLFLKILTNITICVSAVLYLKQSKHETVWKGLTLPNLVGRQLQNTTSQFTTKQSYYAKFHPSVLSINIRFKPTTQKVENYLRDVLK